jgi:hypothetical protein
MPKVPYFSEEFVGRTISFDNPLPSPWLLTEKLSENSDVDDEDDPEGVPSEARAVFIARRLSRDAAQQEEGRRLLSKFACSMLLYSHAR